MLWSRKQVALANWCALTDHSIDAVGDLLGLSPRCVRVIQDCSQMHVDRRAVGAVVVPVGLAFVVITIVVVVIALMIPIMLTCKLARLRS
jgi:hypothetical protein